MDELVHHLDELPHRTALLHDVTGRGVERHHAVTDAPAPLAFRVEPDDALHPLADLPAPADGPARDEVALLLRAPAEAELFLDLAGQTPVHRPHLGHLGPGEGEW